MKLIYIRHGETDWNTLHLLQGSTDIPLNETGRLQAQKTAQILSTQPFQRIFCSPLLRAKETAQIINQTRNVPLTCDDRIRERGFGSLEGKPFTQKDFDQWWKSNFNGTLYGMESIDELRTRVSSLLDELCLLFPEETILMVAHGGTFVAVDSYFNGYPSDGETLRFIPNCTFKIFESQK